MSTDLTLKVLMIPYYHLDLIHDTLIEWDYGMESCVLLVSQKVDLFEGQ